MWAILKPPFDGDIGEERNDEIHCVLSELEYCIKKEVYITAGSFVYELKYKV